MKQTPNLQNLWVSCQQEGVPTQLEACQGAGQAKKGPAGSSVGGQPQGSDVLPGQESVSAGPGWLGTQSLLCVMFPQGPVLGGTWAPGRQGVCVCWDPGHEVCTDRANPSPELRTPTGQQLTTQVHTGGSGPKQVAQFLHGRHLGSPWRSLLGPLRLTPPRRLQRERQAAHWRQKHVCSDDRGPATRGRARAGADVSVQPLPTTPGFPGQSAESRRVASS